MAKMDITGQRYGRLVALHIEQTFSRHTHWRCKCDCGREVVVELGSLRKKNERRRTKSCGCLSKERMAKLNFSHGQSVARGAKKGSRLYEIWHNMRARCNRAGDIGYHRYGGRGIKVCPEWDADFVQFQRWALTNGYVDNLSIDRINNDGPYAPGNCRWVTSKAQARNRRTNTMITYRGKTACLAEHAEDVGISPKVVAGRIRLGWPIENSFNTPVRSKV